MLLAGGRVRSRGVGGGVAAATGGRARRGRLGTWSGRGAGRLAACGTGRRAGCGTGRLAGCGVRRAGLAVGRCRRTPSCVGRGRRATTRDAGRGTPPAAWIAAAAAGRGPVSTGEVSPGGPEAREVVAATVARAAATGTSLPGSAALPGSGRSISGGGATTGADVALSGAAGAGSVGAASGREAASEGECSPAAGGSASSAGAGGAASSAGAGGAASSAGAGGAASSAGAGG